MQTRIHKNEIQVGAAVQWPVYDSKGRLLLKKGTVINSERQLDTLVKLGLYRQRERGGRGADGPAIQERLSPFTLQADIINRIECINRSLINADDGVAERIPRLAADIRKMCQEDLDATVGAIHLSHDHDYVTMHPLHVTVLCQMLADFLDYDLERQIRLLSAALTANIGMLNLQSKLHNQQEPLSPFQRQEIKEHPGRSVEILKSVGLDDKYLLDIILQHHERIDGSGYLGLKGNQILEEAKIIGLTDRYAAMISSRCHRRGKYPNECLKLLFMSKGGEFDETLSLAFIKIMGIFPPGSFVDLENGEIAVVVKRPVDGIWPTVKSVVTARGGPFITPLRRNCNNPGEGIKGLHTAKDLPPLNLNLLWDYSK
jgi:hypothetical protein